MHVYFVEITFSPFRGCELVNRYLVQAESSFEARAICKQDIRSVNGQETRFLFAFASHIPGVTLDEDMKLLP